MPSALRDPQAKGWLPVLPLLAQISDAYLVPDHHLHAVRIGLGHGHRFGPGSARSALVMPSGCPLGHWTSSMR